MDNCPTNEGSCSIGVIVLKGRCPERVVALGGCCPKGSCPRVVIVLGGSLPQCS